MNITDLGRIASHFYIKYDTVETFNELLKPIMNEGEIINMIANAQEFQQLKVRDNEWDELDDLNHELCEVPVKGGSPWKNQYSNADLFIAWICKII